MNAETEKLRNQLIEKVGQKGLSDLQESVNEMKALGQFKQYVAQRKLELIMGQNGKLLDMLLTIGILK